MQKSNIFRKIIFIIVIFFVLTFGLKNILAQNTSNFDVSLIPNDNNLLYQDYLDNISAKEAWDISSRSPEVVVAVIDSGVDIEHPDLVGNIWKNASEIKDGIDNDNNGYIDDITGWDFVLNSPDPRPKFGGSYTNIGINHGTVVSGIIGAVGNNNFGITGISWNVKIMPLKVIDGSGSGATSLVYQAIKYAMNKDVDIINLSMVGELFDPLLNQIIKEAYDQGIVIVAAAGNETTKGDSDVSLDLAAYPQYPICHDGAEDNNYVLGVGAVDSNDVKSKFSNYGSECIDIVAPGEGFWGLTYFSPVIPGYNKYFGGYWNGTSLSVPLVSGTAALIKNIRPDLSNTEIYELIMENADDINDQNPNYRDLLGSGRLNIENTLKAAGGNAAMASLLVSPMGSYKPSVITFNSLGSSQSEFLAYSENFKGGVSLASADFNNDGINEIITGAGHGGGPHVRVFDQNGNILNQFFAYELMYDGGVNVVAGDIDGDGEIEIITAPRGGKIPLIKVFNLAGQFESNFTSYSRIVGVNLSLSDINADGIMEIVTSPMGVINPEVKIFNKMGTLLSSFNAYEQRFDGGLKAAAYDVFSDSRTEIITFPRNEHDALVRIFSTSGDLLSQWNAWTEEESNKADLAVGDVDFDGEPEVIVSNVLDNQTVTKIFTIDGQLKNKFNAIDNNFTGGINLSIK